MAISDTQKVDYLWKKVGYGAAKRDINSILNATQEGVPSPLLLRGENVWAQGNLIPEIIPGSSSGVVSVYTTGSPLELSSYDTSARDYRSWNTGITDWIPPEFGSTYVVKVYVHTSGDAANASTSGTQLFGSGSGNNDEWFFDYQAGTLNFIGTNLPSGVNFSGKSIYISGAVYSGIQGVAVPGAANTFTSLSITDLTDNILGNPDTGAVQIDGGLGINKNVTIGAGLSIGSVLNVTGVSTFQSDVYYGDNVRLRLGDNLVTGGDFHIYYDGDNSVVADYGIGGLQLGGSSVLIRGVSGGNLTSNVATFLPDGPVELYYINSKKFATTGFGVTVFGGLLVSGITTYTDTTDNTLGDADTGAFQIDGGLGVNKNVTVGGNLNVQGYSELVGVVTFRGGTINIGDADTDDVNIGGEFISSLIPNDDATYVLGTSSKRWRDGNFSGIVTTNNLYAAGITTTVLFNVGVGGTVITTTETGLVGINSTAPTVTLDVDGTINSSTDVTINGTSVLTTATNDAVALAIALG